MRSIEALNFETQVLPARAVPVTVSSCPVGKGMSSYIELLVSEQQTFSPQQFISFISSFILTLDIVKLQCIGGLTSDIETLHLPRSILGCAQTLSEFYLASPFSAFFLWSQFSMENCCCFE